MAVYGRPPRLMLRAALAGSALRWATALLSAFSSLTSALCTSLARGSCSSSYFVRQM